MTTKDSLKAGFYTALVSFVTLFGASLLGWLTDVWEWAASTDDAVLFPDPSVLVKAGVAAVVAALIGVVNFAIRWAQGKVGVGEAPTYVKPPPA